MTPSALTYALVTPARDERDNLPRLAASVLGQTVPPQAWVVVDDHSQDGSLELVQALADAHPLVRARAWDGPGAGALSEGRREGRDLHAFRFGIGCLDAPVDVVVKVDADTSFDPDYFERLLGRFAADARLGIAGGACLEREDGAWVLRSTTSTHPRGASRAYRWACVDDLMALEPRMGWDGLDEVRVSLRGFRTRQFGDLAFRHHRPEAGRERHPLRARALSGRASWYMGYRPSYLVLRALHRARTDPAALAMVWGYAAEAIRRSPRCADPAIVAAVQERQALTSLLRHGLPART